MSPIGLKVAPIGLGDLGVPRGVTQLVACDLPEGVAADHPMPLGADGVDRGVRRKGQRPPGVDATVVAERPTVGLPDALVQLDDLDVALAGPQVLLCEQPEGVVTLRRDGGGSRACSSTGRATARPWREAGDCSRSSSMSIRSAPTDAAATAAATPDAPDTVDATAAPRPGHWPRGSAPPRPQPPGQRPRAAARPSRAASAWAPGGRLPMSPTRC